LGWEAEVCGAGFARARRAQLGAQGIFDDSVRLNEKLQRKVVSVPSLAIELHHARQTLTYGPSVTGTFTPRPEPAGTRPRWLAETRAIG